MDPRNRKKKKGRLCVHGALNCRINLKTIIARNHVTIRDKGHINSGKEEKRPLSPKKPSCAVPLKVPSTQKRLARLPTIQRGWRWLVDRFSSAASSLAGFNQDVPWGFITGLPIRSLTPSSPGSAAQKPRRRPGSPLCTLRFQLLGSIAPASRSKLGESIPLAID